MEAIQKQLNYRTNWLKAQSKYYPQILILPEMNNINRQGEFNFVATTLVRKKWNDTWYTIHHVCSVCIKDKNKNTAKLKAKSYLLEKMMYNVHNTNHLYTVTGGREDIDISQQDEQERLMMLLKI